MHIYIIVVLKKINIQPSKVNKMATVQKKTYGADAVTKIYSMGVVVIYYYYHLFKKSRNIPVHTFIINVS